MNNEKKYPSQTREASSNEWFATKESLQELLSYRNAHLAKLPDKERGAVDGLYTVISGAITTIDNLHIQLAIADAITHIQKRMLTDKSEEPPAGEGEPHG